MTIEEYKCWVNQFLKKTQSQPKKLFFEVVDLANELKQSRIFLNHHMESSFNSQDKISLIKVTHIFRYPRFFKQKNCMDLINYKLILNLIEKINKIFKVNFNTKLIEYIFSIPLSFGYKNDGIVFCVDFNSDYNYFDKVSIYLNPIETSWIFKIAKSLRIKNTKLIYQNLKNLEFIGIDFYLNGKCVLKTYQEFHSLPTRLKKRRKEIFHRINKSGENGPYLIMNKFNNNSSFLEKSIYLNWEGLDYTDLLKLNFSKSFKDFLEQIRLYIINFQIIFVAFKGKRLELYFK